MVAQLKLAKEALSKVVEGDANHDYYLNKIREQISSLEQYVNSLETHVHALTNQLDAERKS